MVDQLIDATIIRRTQGTLGKFVKKPNLSDKLLSKPPFRFLFDVINVVINKTSVFRELYSVDELNYINIKNREDKMRFLQKMIDVVELTTNVSLGIKTSKILAGQQAEKTNKLLQGMAEIIEKQLDWKVAVERVLNEDKRIHSISDKTAKHSKTGATVKVVKKVAKDKNVNNILTHTPENQSGNGKNPSLLKNKETLVVTDDGSLLISHLADKQEINSKNIVEKNEEKNISGKKYEKSEKLKIDANKNISDKDSYLSTKTPNSTHLPKEIKNLEKIMDEKDIKPDAGQIASGNYDAVRNGNKSNEVTSDIINNTNETNILEGNSLIETVEKHPAISETTSIVDEQKDEKAAKFNIINETLSSNNDSLKVKRESTFIQESNHNQVTLDEDKSVEPRQSTLRPPSVRPPSARPGAPRRRDRNVEIIIDSNHLTKTTGVNVKLEPFTDLDDSEGFVIVSNNSASKDNTVYNNAASITNSEQGHLVQQILETQRKLVHPDDINEEETKLKLEMKKRQTTSNQHIGNVSESIQTLTKCVNPLGKLFEFIPEDIDAMQLEYHIWRDQWFQASGNLRKVKLRTNSIIESLKTQLADLEIQISEYHQMINLCHLRILQNRNKLFTIYCEY